MVLGLFSHLLTEDRKKMMESRGGTDGEVGKHAPPEHTGNASHRGGGDVSVSS